MQKSFILFILQVFLFFCTTSAQVKLLENEKFPALFSFGDSILDTGNNNNFNTVTKCNFPPYGRDFPGGIPTGRFCNGKVPSDLIAEALGIKDTLPAYLDPNLQSNDLPTGVCFASGGSGCDPLTATIQGILSLSDQLGLFQQYIGKLKGVVGEARANDIISNSLFLVSAGNNDIAISYSITARRFQYDFPSYANQLVTWSSTFLKDLYGLGARRIGVLSTLPLGCLPGARAVGALEAGCEVITNQEAQLFNTKLSSMVDSLESTLPNAKLVFIDVYNPLFDIVRDPQNYGFLVTRNACCGTGTFEIGVTCNQFTPLTCPDASTYVFWDSGHPTERAYRIIVSEIVHKYFNNFI
ncbi:GDSL esterase/lipase At5g63170 [Fagus crenata]